MLKLGTANPTERTLGLIMESLRLSPLLGQIQYLVAMAMLMARYDPQSEAYTTSLKRLVLTTVDFEEACKSLRLPMTGIAIDRLLGELEATQKLLNEGPRELLNHDHLVREINGTIKTLKDEASLRLYFHLPAESRDLYENLSPFGEAVKQAFPAATIDVEEAAKCLALLRPTASVFHSQRAVEFGLRKIIMESFAEPSFFLQTGTWGAITSRIRREANKPDIAAKPGADAIAILWRGKQDRLMKIALLVQQVADAFRNPTMHCESVYTAEQARDVFNATGAFLRRLAEDFGEATHTHDGKEA